MQPIDGWGRMYRESGDRERDRGREIEGGRWREGRGRIKRAGRVAVEVVHIQIAHRCSDLSTSSCRCGEEHWAAAAAAVL